VTSRFVMALYDDDYWMISTPARIFRLLSRLVCALPHIGQEGCRVYKSERSF
jgi:hypothetical protein